MQQHMAMFQTECMNFANDTHEARGTMLSTWVCANGAGRDQGRSPGQAYLLATYFSITTVSTIGYGDISPELDNDTEVLFTLLVEFVGMFIFGVQYNAKTSNEMQPVR